MANTKITTNVIADGAITSAKLDTNITISGNITGTLATAAQPNITSVGTLTGLDVSGNITVGTLNTIIAENNIRFKPTGAVYIDHNTVGQDINFRVSNASTLDTTPLVIKSSGNVGIGVSPAQKLHVSGNAYVAAGNYFTDSTSGYFFGGSGSFTNGVYGVGTNNMAFNVNGSERMRIASDGDITQTGGINDSIIFTIKTSATNDYVGQIKFDDNSGTRSSIMSDHYNNALIFKHNSDIERMRIDSSGRITLSNSEGIKLSEKSSTLYNEDGALSYFASNNGVYLNGAGANGWLRLNASGVSNDRTAINLFGANAGDYIQFRVANNTALQINSSGNVLVGTTNAVGPGIIMIKSTATTTGCLGMHNTNNGGSFIRFANAANNAVIGTIQNNNDNSTSYNTTSDYRLKENVDYDFNALDRVAQLKPARFNFIADADRTVDGFLAHEVQDIVPEAITGEKDAVREEEYEITPAVLDDDGNVVTEAEMGTREIPDYQGIDQSKLVPLLTKAIQEQQTIIDDLKTRIEALEG